MTVVADHGTPARPEEASTAAAAAPRRGLLFWIRRYLPAEIACTVLMLVAGLVMARWIGAPAAIAAAAYLGETVGFYGVLALAIYLEQSRVVRSRRRATVRTVLLLFAEFGAAELIDSLLVRPAALLLGVMWIPDPAWGLIAGKIAADVVFYTVAAVAFTITAKTGVRQAHRDEVAS